MEYINNTTTKMSGMNNANTTTTARLSSKEKKAAERAERAAKAEAKAQAALAAADATAKRPQEEEETDEVPTAKRPRPEEAEQINKTTILTEQLYDARVEVEHAKAKVLVTEANARVALAEQEVAFMKKMATVVEYGAAKLADATSAHLATNALVIEQYANTTSENQKERHEVMMALASSRGYPGLLQLNNSVPRPLAIGEGDTQPYDPSDDEPIDGKKARSDTDPSTTESEEPHKASRPHVSRADKKRAADTQLQKALDKTDKADGDFAPKKHRAAPGEGAEKEVTRAATVLHALAMTSTDLRKPLPPTQSAAGCFGNGLTLKQYFPAAGKTLLTEPLCIPVPPGIGMAPPLHDAHDTARFLSGVLMNAYTFDTKYMEKLPKATAANYRKQLASAKQRLGASINKWFGADSAYATLFAALQTDGTKLVPEDWADHVMVATKSTPGKKGSTRISIIGLDLVSKDGLTSMHFGTDMGELLRAVFIGQIQAMNADGAQGAAERAVAMQTVGAAFDAFASADLPLNDAGVAAEMAYVATLATQAASAAAKAKADKPVAAEDLMGGLQTVLPLSKDPTPTYDYDLRPAPALVDDAATQPMQLDGQADETQAVQSPQRSQSEKRTYDDMAGFLLACPTPSADVQMSEQSLEALFQAAQGNGSFSPLNL